MDPLTIHDRTTLGAALGALRAGASNGGTELTYTEVRERSAALAGTDPALETCSEGSLSAWIAGTRLPRASSPQFRCFLLVCGVGRDELPAWTDALRRARDIAAPPSTPGSPLPERFEDVERLDGAGCEQYRARCPALGPGRVLVTVLPPSSSPDEREVFAAGHEVASRYDHPHITRVLEADTFDDGRPWVVEHHNDRSTIADAGPLPLEHVLAIGARIAEVLDLLHADGILHRDVRPETLALTARGEPVLRGFGLAGPPAARTDAVALGRDPAPGAAPAARELGRFGRRDDLFALGRTLAALGESPPPGLASLIDRMTAPEPHRRPGSAGQVVDAIRELQQELAKTPDARDTPDPGDTAAYDVPPRPTSWARAAAGPAARAAADQLAQSVERQWNAEAGVRRLGDPHPLPVSWRPAPGDLVVGWSAVEAAAESVRSAGWAEGPGTLAGTTDDVVDVVARRVPSGRLLVLGDAGAGKSVLLLTLVRALLRNRDAIGGRVPVLLSVASWSDPDVTDLRSWMAGMLVADHSWLGARDPDPGPHRALVEALLDAHLLYPVLDGLDEAPPVVRARATGRINDWLASSPRHRLTVACRRADFEAMIHPAQGPAARRLTGTAGVLLDELAADDVRVYLERDTDHPDPAGHWAPVLAELDGPVPVGAALRTPLMVALARTVYGPGADATPGELGDRDRFPTREAVERHLFDGFVPAAYRDPPDAALRSRWSAERAERWLRRLARHLGDPSGPPQGGAPGTTPRAPLHTVDLTWWELPATLTAWQLGASVAVLPALVVGVATVVGPGLGMGLGVGLLVGVLAALGFGRLGMPRTVRGGPITGIAVAAGAAVAGALVGGGLGASLGLGRGVTGGLIGAIGVGLGVGPLGGWRSGAVAGGLGGITVGLLAGSGQGPVAGVLDGLGAGLATGAVVVLAGRRRPARGVRRSGWSLWPSIAAAVIGGVAGGLTAGRVAAVVAAVAGFCLGLLSRDADPRDATSPAVALRRDRGTALLSGGLIGVTILAGASLVVAPVVGVAGGLTVGLVFACLQATWPQYTVARSWLALRGELPWDLMNFLADAHEKRGVLRRVGLTYQFRHVELQRRLADADGRAS